MCRNFLAQLREQYKLLSKNGVQVIVISPSNRILLEKFINAFGPYPFSIYGDPDRVLYQKMGHKSMAKWKLLVKAGKAYLKSGKSAFIPQDEKQKKVVLAAMKTQDVYIQGGSWIFDEEGNTIWSHVDELPEDHATIEQIVNQLNTGGVNNDSRSFI